MKIAGALARYAYIVVVGVVTLNLVVLTLAAHRFQGEMKTVTVDQPVQAGIAAPPATSTTDVIGSLREWQSKVAAARRVLDARWKDVVFAADHLPLADVPATCARPIQEQQASLPWIFKRIIAAASAGETGGDAAPAGGWSARMQEACESYWDADAILLQSESTFSGSAAPLQQVLYFRTLEPLTLGLVDPVSFALMPPWLLTLMVTVAMGALGSLLYVTKSFLTDRLDESRGVERDYQPLAWFMLRPLLGVITAFAVFVFLQAGLAVTDGALASPADVVNPYLVGFLAIVSGPMSWQGIGRIERWGTRFFGDENIARWAYGMRGTFAVQQKDDPAKTTAALAASLGVTAEQIVA